MKTPILALALALSTALFAQPDTKPISPGEGTKAEFTPEQRESRRAEIESRKVAYITNAMQLTTEEAQAFWPVYNAYESDKRKLREGGKSQWKERQAQGDVGPEELDRQMKERFALERRRIDIDETYYNKFKGILSPEKVALYYAAEQDFKREMMRSIRERPDAEGGQREMQREQMHERRER